MEGLIPKWYISNAHRGWLGARLVDIETPVLVCTHDLLKWCMLPFFFLYCCPPTPSFFGSLCSRSTAKVVAEEALNTKTAFGEQRAWRVLSELLYEPPPDFSMAEHKLGSCPNPYPPYCLVRGLAGLFRVNPACLRSRHY